MRPSRARKNLRPPSLPHTRTVKTCSTTRLRLHISPASWPPNFGLDDSCQASRLVARPRQRRLTTKSSGSHAVIGADACTPLRRRPEIVHAIEAHHNDVESHEQRPRRTRASRRCRFRCASWCTQKALDAYVKRLEKLEEIANSYKGRRAHLRYQAGREVPRHGRARSLDELRPSSWLTISLTALSECSTGQVKIVVIP